MNVKLAALITFICLIILFVISIMAEQGESRIKDFNIRTQLGKSYQAEGDSGLQNQPLSQDWVELDPTAITYASATTFTTSGINNIERFQIGDRLEIAQDDATKYFVVIKSTESLVYITGGDNYTYTNSSLNRLRISRSHSPFGFPAFFTSASTLTNEDGTSITYLGDGYSAITFRLDGRVVLASIIIDNADLPANVQQVRASVPFENLYLQETLAFFKEDVRISNFGSYIDGIMYYQTFDESVGTDPYFVFFKEDLSNFTAGSFTVEVSNVFILQ